MQNGANYQRHLESEVCSARHDAVRLETLARAAEAGFRRALPFDETPTEVLGFTLRLMPDVVARREAFRAAHAEHCRALGDLAEAEGEIHRFPEDYH